MTLLSQYLKIRSWICVKRDRKLFLEQNIIVCFRKDVRLPVQLQRAMAAEAEAAREARAKVNRTDLHTSHPSLISGHCCRGGTKSF